MIEPECRLWGQSFSPKLIKDIPEIKFITENEPGDIGVSGRYKNLPIPYGACYLSTPFEISQDNKINWMAQFIESHIFTFRKAGATEITFWINWHGVQGNMELSVNQLTKIASLNIPLGMNYIFKGG